MDNFIPVAMTTEMLLNPGGHYPYHSQQRTFPDIRMIWWAGGNPFHHHQDLNRLHQAFQRLETIIVNEINWTATARHADIVLRDAVKGNLTRYTNKTLTRITDLDADMARRIERGYSYDADEFREGIISVGAAISLPDKETIAAIGISLPEVNLGDVSEKKLGVLVAEAAAKVSAKLQRF